MVLRISAHNGLVELRPASNPDDWGECTSARLIYSRIATPDPGPGGEPSEPIEPGTAMANWRMQTLMRIDGPRCCAEPGCKVLVDLEEQTDYPGIFGDIELGIRLFNVAYGSLMRFSVRDGEVLELLERLRRHWLDQHASFTHDKDGVRARAGRAGARRARRGARAARGRHADRSRRRGRRAARRRAAVARGGRDGVARDDYATRGARALGRGETRSGGARATRNVRRARERATKQKDHFGDSKNKAQETPGAATRRRRRPARAGSGGSARRRRRRRPGGAGRRLGLLRRMPGRGPVDRAGAVRARLLLRRVRAGALDVPHVPRGRRWARPPILLAPVLIYFFFNRWRTRRPKPVAGGIRCLLGLFLA